MMGLRDEDALLEKRFFELAGRSFRNGIFLFTDFLSVGEQAVFFEMERELKFAGCELYGGTERCERRMLRFGSEEACGYEAEFPIACVRIRPAQKKFADELTHRDVLGALMHLGVERGVLGDIFVKEQEAVLFCRDSMADFVAENLVRIRHTTVICALIDEIPPGLAPKLRAEELVVSSDRADGIVAKVYGLSRSESLGLFRQKKIFVNGRKYENNSGVLKDGDLVSVRGYGRFIFEGTLRETKKGRNRIKISRYI